MAQESRSIDPAPVAIVGAGPVGLSLALGLARHGVRSVLLERNPTTARTSRAPAIHVRTREILRQWNVEQAFLREGSLLRAFTFHSASRDRPLLRMDFADLEEEADRPGLLILEQNRTEELLLEAVRNSGLCDVRFDTEVRGVEPHETGVRVISEHHGAESTMEAIYLVGCDGASSFVREALGLPFPGETYQLSPLLADVRMSPSCDDLAWPRVWNAGGGFSFAVRMPGGLWRIVCIQRGQPRGGDRVDDEEVQSAVTRLMGQPAEGIEWASRFRIHIRSSPRFRLGRALLAGDAAHVHSPAWGFGMNGGIQDAHNLAWKLAAVLDGGDEERLLDSYEVERRAVVVQQVSRFTDLFTRLFLDSPAGLRSAAFFLFRQALRSARLRKRTLRRAAMLDLDYPPSPLLSDEDRSAGVRLPDPPLRAPGGEQVRLHDLLPLGPALLQVTESGDLDHPPSVETVIRIGRGAYEDPSGRLRQLLGERDGWILVRPDRYVSWARSGLEGMDDRVNAALGRG